MHTRWIETEFDNTIPPYAGARRRGAAEPASARRVVVEVGGKRLEVVLPGRARRVRGGAARRRQKAPRRARRRQGGGAAASGDALTAPMQGTIVKIAVEEGQPVEAEGDLVVVLEAMKMEQPITAHKAGTSPAWPPRSARPSTNGAVIADIKDWRRRRLSGVRDAGRRSCRTRDRAQASAWGPDPASARPASGGTGPADRWCRLRRTRWGWRGHGARRRGRRTGLGGRDDVCGHPPTLATGLPGATAQRSSVE